MHVDWADAAQRVGLDPAALSLEELPHNRWLTQGIWLIDSSDRRMVLKCLQVDGRPGDQWDVDDYARNLQRGSIPRAAASTRSPRPCRESFATWTTGPRT